MKGEIAKNNIFGDVKQPDLRGGNVATLFSLGTANTVVVEASSLHRRRIRRSRNVFIAATNKRKFCNGPFASSIGGSYFNLSNDSSTSSGVANQSEIKSYICYCVNAKGTSYTWWAHMHITPSFPNSHTYLFSARFIVNVTLQRGNDRNLQTIYCYACSLVGTRFSRPTIDRNFCDLHE